MTGGNSFILGRRMQSFTRTSRLALPFLLLLLQLLTPGQMLALQEGGQSTVMRFRDVLKKSKCQPMEQLVDVLQEFPDHVEYIYMPSCVPLTRCSGCCFDEEEKCEPTSLRNVTLQVQQVSINSSQEVKLAFTEHQACECRSIRKRKNIKCSKKMMKRRHQMKKQEKKASRCGKLRRQRKKTNLV